MMTSFERLIMAKRFTDTSKWDKVWFRKLSPVHKCFWNYVCERCDHAGVWEVDFELASVFIGSPLDEPEIRNIFSKQYKELNGGSRWFITDFLSFQYGSYDESNKMFKPIKNILERHGVSMGDVWGIDALNVKEQVKVKVKERVVGKTKTLEDCISELKKIYDYVDFETELKKMDAWLSLPKNNHRKKTKEFMVNWLNKIERPLVQEKKKTIVRYVNEKPEGIPHNHPELSKMIHETAKKLGS